MGPDGCHAVRVRGEWQGFEGVTRLMVSHKSSGGCRALVHGLPWSPVTASDHERQGLRGCHALGFVVSDHERNGAGRVSRGSGPW